MSLTTPNKETVRRICLLSGATYCYMLINSEAACIEVLCDIKKEELDHCQQELRDWCGMKFCIYSVFEPGENTGENTDRIEQQGEKILPIDLDNIESILK